MTFKNCIKSIVQEQNLGSTLSILLLYSSYEEHCWNLASAENLLLTIFNQGWHTLAICTQLFQADSAIN